MKYIKLICLSFILLLTSCGEERSSNQESQSTTTTQSRGNYPKEVALELNSNDQMRYDKLLLRVKAGQEVTLTLNHTGEQPKNLMGHNFVLLKKGTDVDQFASKAVVAIENDYIPADTEAVIVHTKMIGGGESTTVTFDAPAKGSYDYLCSFPGHHGLMRGKFIVE